MTRNEQQMYFNVSSIAKSLEKIATALEAKNKLGKLVYKDDGTVDFKPKDIPGFEGTLDALDVLTDIKTITDDYASKENLANTICDDCNNENQHGIVDKCVCQDDGGDGYYTTDKNGNRYTYEPNPNRDKGEPALLEYVDGIKNDSDHDIRSTAKMYTDELSEGHNHLINTKKDCILDYVTNEFGLHGARYTDIIKFAYYLGSPNALKYTSANRGYYSCAFNTRLSGHLIQGGKDQLVKGINNEGKERYFALSSVDNFTDYYKRIQ